MSERKSPASALLPWLAAGAAVTAGLAGATVHLLRRTRPQLAGTIQVKGLRAPVEIVRDRWGVPHIYAGSDEDALFGMGYVQAQDRLWQMELHRRVGQGRLAEVVGEPGLASDRFARTIGFHRAAAAQLECLDDDSARLLEAYVAGINGFMAQGRLPPEFLLLQYAPEPWQPLDSAAWGMVLAWGLGGNWETELMRAALLDFLGPEVAARLEPHYTAEHVSILQGEPVPLEEASDLLEQYRAAQRYLQPSGLSIGSNNWSIHGSRTTSGAPILASDPHLPLYFPNLWYEVHLEGGSFQVIGASSPGLPGVLIGHNAAIAWGITNAVADVQDLYVERPHPEDLDRVEFHGQWEPLRVIPEEIRVRGKDPVTLNVRLSHHGPIISDLFELHRVGCDSRSPGDRVPVPPQPHPRMLSLRWIGHTPAPSMRATLQLDRALDWNSFRAALAEWHAPALNFAYADVNGHIGYTLGGSIPIRVQGSGLLPVPGWDGEHEWAGTVPAAEMPQALDPPSGYIATANNRIAGPEYPYVLTTEWLPGWRARRIAELIEAQPTIGPDDCARMQMDVYSLPARSFVPLLLALEPDDGESRRALDLLRTWDLRLDRDSPAAAIFEGCLIHLVQRVLAEDLGSLAEIYLDARRPDSFPTNPLADPAVGLVIERLAGSRVDSSVLLQAFRSAVADLHQLFGDDMNTWRWGRLHRAYFRHPLAVIPGLGLFFNRQPVEMGGDGYTVQQTDFALHFPPGPITVVPSYRMICDLSNWDSSRSVLPGGQSGHPLSRHYDDLIQPWKDGEYHPQLWSRQAVLAMMENTLQLEPER